MEIVLEHKMNIDGFKVYSKTGSKYSVLVLEDEPSGDYLIVDIKEEKKDE